MDSILNRTEKDGAVDVLNPLEALVALPDAERERRGLQDTPREILQQPDTWLETIDRMAGLRPSLDAYITEFLKDASDTGQGGNQGSRPVVVLVGAGTSDYIGRTISRVLRRQWGCEVSAVPSTELLTNLDDYVLPGCRCLFISFSRSGDSSEGVAVLEMAQRRYPTQVRHLVITCNENGAMAKMAGVRTVVLGARTNDRGLAMTSSFTNMVLAGLLLAFVREPERFVPHAKALAAIGAAKTGEMAAAAAALAAQRFRRVCFLGTGALQSVAEESSLKVLELNAGRIATIAQSALGLRHGPLSFIDKRTLVAAYLSGEVQRLQYELDLLDEIHEKQLGAVALAVAPRQTAELDRAKARVLVLDAPEDLPDFCLPVVDILMGQMLGLFLSVENGITPDTPSTGAISRVVSHVKIYPEDEEARD